MSTSLCSSLPPHTAHFWLHNLQRIEHRSFLFHLFHNGTLLLPHDDGITPYFKDVRYCNAPLPPEPSFRKNPLHLQRLRIELHITATPDLLPALGTHLLPENSTAVFQETLQPHYFRGIAECICAANVDAGTEPDDVHGSAEEETAAESVVHPDEYPLHFPRIGMDEHSGNSPEWFPGGLL